MAPLAADFLFIASFMDPAGMLMAEYLSNLYDFEEINKNIYVCSKNNWILTYVEKDIIYVDGIERELDITPKTIIFLSRHSSKSEFPTLSTHVTGNPTKEATYGGYPYSLAPSNPILMKSVLYYMNLLVENRYLKYHVTLEVTHHGPTEIFSPSLFVEVGSTINQWKDKKATNTVVDALLTAIKKPLKGVPAVGFGGPHYAPTFTKYSLEKKYAFGHILSKYVISDTTDKVIRDAFKKTDDAKIAVINWKGMPGKIRKKLHENLIQKGIEVIKA